MLKSEEFTMQAVEALRKGEQKNVYRLVCGKCGGNRNVTIRDKQGHLHLRERPGGMMGGTFLGSRHQTSTRRGA